MIKLEHVHGNERINGEKEPKEKDSRRLERRAKKNEEEMTADKNKK